MDQANVGASWDARYAAGPAEGLFGAEPSAYLRAVAAQKDFAPATALFIADGDGRNSRWLARRGVRCAALDLSAEAARRARALDEAAGVSVERLCKDVAAWAPGTRRWDAVAIIGLHGPADVRAAAISRAWAALAPCGWFMLDGFEKAQAPHPIGPDTPGLLYARDEVLALLPEAELYEALVGPVRLKEGARHDGVAEMVRILARRPR